MPSGGWWSPIERLMGLHSLGMLTTWFVWKILKAATKQAYQTGVSVISLKGCIVQALEHKRR